MLEIVIVGCGNIGSRHLQSCLNLDKNAYQITVVEPSDRMLKNAQEIVADSGSEVAIRWASSLNELPLDIDVAIVATSSDVRRNITLQLLEHSKIKYMILEKVLFQDFSSFEQVEQAIEDSRVVTFVNCPMREWPVYQKLRETLRNEKISRIHVNFIGADVGCNGIHYIDIIGFLLGKDTYTLESFDLSNQSPAKRKGFLHLSGVLRGDFQSSFGLVPFEIDAREGDFVGSVVNFEIENKGDITLTENGSSIEVSGSYRSKNIPSVWDAPYQSAMTASYVESVLSTGTLNLSTFSESKSLHLPMISAFLKALNAQNVLANPDLCPIT